MKKRTKIVIGSAVGVLVVGGVMSVKWVDHLKNM